MAAAMLAGGAFGGAVAYGIRGSWAEISLMVVGGVLAAIVGIGAAGAFDERRWWE
jgi:hypothetical protein